MRVRPPRCWLFVGVAVCCMAFAAATARAQSTSAATGGIAGSVTDPTGAVIPDAAVILTRAGSAPVSTTSDGQGRFSVAGLAPGAYDVQARASGFRPERREHVTVSAGRMQRLVLKLTIQIQQQQVTVNSNQLNSSPDKNADAVVLKGADLDSLPDDPNDLQTELEAMAGADPDAGPQFYIDGFSGGHLPPKSSIREIRINQNPFSAQYDEVGWGRIEIFTKPGSDQLHGNFWVEGNDSSFNSRNPFVTEQPPYHSINLEGNLDGRVTRHASQFTDLWRETNSDDSIVNAFVLNSAFNPTPFTAVYPTNSSNTWLSSRFDLGMGEEQTLTARYQLSQSGQTNAGVGQFALSSQAYNNSSVEQTLQLSDSQTYGAKLLNETRFQYIRDRNRQTPQTAGPTLVVQGGFTGGGSNLGLNIDNQDHYELQDYVQTTHGRHTIDFGIRLRDTRDANDSTANFNGQYTFASLSAYQITEQGMQQGWTPEQIFAAGGGPSLFSQTTGTPSVVVSVFDAGLYAEDNYKLRPNVTVSLGLRFESQTQIPDHADWAPRFGISWAIQHGKNKPPLAVLRGGFGLFYQRFPSTAVLEAQRENGVLQKTLVVNDPQFYPAVCSSSPGDCSGASTLSPTTYQIGPAVHAPYLMVASMGADRSLGKIGSLSVVYQHWRGDHLLLTRNINAPLPGTYDPADPASGVRPLGTDQNIYQYESEGESVRNRLVVNANAHAKSFGLYVSWSLSKSEADTAGIGSFPSNGYDLHQDWGRASNDIRNHAFLGGYWNLWRGIGANPFLIYASGAPFNIVVGQDLNGDTQFNDRPTFATDFSRPSVVRTAWGVFDTQPIAGQKTIPIEFGKGPGTLLLNMRLMKNFNFGPVLPEPAPPAAAAGKTAKPAKKKAPERKYTASIGVSAENVLNHVNLAPPVGVLGSPLFGRSTALSGIFGSGSANRTVQANFYFRF